MKEDSKNMRVELPNNAFLIMEWPETISTEDLEVVEQILSIQLRSVQRAIERRKAEEQRKRDEAEQQAIKMAEQAESEGGHND
jgi:hypothetical protein